MKGVKIKSKTIIYDNDRTSIYLPSVGCFFECSDIEPDVPVIYPANANITPDTNCPTPLSDCTEEWFNTISAADKQLVWDTFKIEIETI